MWTTRRTALLLLPLIFAVAAPTFSQVTVDDEVHRVIPSEARISPDGKYVVFVRSDLDWDENKRSTKLVLAAVDGGMPVAFTAGPSDRRPRWSPDGAHIAFLRTPKKGDGDEDAKTQVWMIRSGGGEAFALTEHPEGISSFEWMRASDAVVFIAQDPRDEDEKKEEKKGDDAIFVYEGPNGQDKRNRWSNLWVKAIEGSEKARQLTHEEILPSQLAVSPDGRRVAVVFRREDTRNHSHLTELAVVDVESGTFRQVTRNETPESNVAWRPDGKALSVLAPDESTWELAQSKIYGVDLETGSLELLSGDFPGEISDYRWRGDGKALYLLAVVRTSVGVYRLDVGAEKAMSLLDQTGRITEISFSNDLRKAALVWADPVTPPDVFTLETGGPPSLRRLSDLNPELRGKASVRLEIVHWASSDSLSIEGLLYLPPGDTAEKPMPFLLQVHGGPAGVFFQGWDVRQLLFTQLGYAVLSPNVRGSTAYGDAFLRGNMRDIGGGDYQDLVTGVDAMIERGVADPERLAVRGWSYGGILGGWTLTQTDRFKAASLGAMVSDWTSEYGQGFNYDVRRWYIGGEPWNDSERYRAMSSITHIDQVTTPTLLLHGDADTTCTVEQSVNFFNALWERGVPTRLIRFPREGHGIREPRHYKLMFEQELAWIRKYVEGVELQSGGAQSGRAQSGEPQSGEPQSGEPQSGEPQSGEPASDLPP